jgi:hypothetical protein
MHEFTGTITDIRADMFNGDVYIVLRANEKQAVLACYNELAKEEKLSITIDKYRESRSSAANRYLWSLCGKLADKLSDGGVPYTKDDVYRDAIKARGLYRDQGNLPLDFSKTSRTAWELIGTGWLTEQVDFEPDGNNVIVRYYYGTSCYNTKQMSRVIDWVVSECQQQGIETKTPDQIANMLSLWKESVVVG